ncbi:igLON family member 5 isoform X2 [Thunnus maccoyii]|uniref:igLON family member 5 isoform X2 n=1 Tax=Thunnus maccoyii TaxID=8240 RepID=UPI001C4BAD0B|nr:igLON family member 5 isoform X2 [Thunnus maccoyii]
MGCPLLRNALAAFILVLLSKGSSVHGAEFGHLPDNITVLEGESVTLRCRIDEEVTHKAWLNRSNILFTGTDKWSLDRRVTLVNSNNSDFSIHIDKVQVTDEGPYTCTFQANNKPRIAHVYLIVQVPARIVNISKNVSVNEGEDVNLYCLAVGRPEPTVTWKDQKYGLVSEGEFLDITEIKRQQAEDYECITNNGVAPPDQRKVKVTVNYPPMITDMKNMPAHLGKTAILRCEAMAVPPASFEWYRDDHRTGGHTGARNRFTSRDERRHLCLGFPLHYSSAEGVKIELQLELSLNVPESPPLSLPPSLTPPLRKEEGNEIL